MFYVCVCVCVCVCGWCTHSLHGSLRLSLHEGHAGGLVVVRVDRGHHLPADGVEDGQRGQGPGDLAVLGQVPQLLGGLLDGAVVHQLDAAPTEEEKKKRKRRSRRGYVT